MKDAKVLVAVFVFALLLGLGVNSLFRASDEPDPPASAEAQIVIDSLARLDGWIAQDNRWVTHPSTGIQLRCGVGCFHKAQVNGTMSEFTSSDLRHLWHAAHRAWYELQARKLEALVGGPAPAPPNRVIITVGGQP